METRGKHYTLLDQDFYLSILHYGHEPKTPSHCHDFFEIVFVDKGFTMHRIKDKIALLLPGDLFVIPPGVYHEYWRSVNNSVFNVVFYPSVLGEDLNELKTLPMLQGMFDTQASEEWLKIHLAPGSRYELLKTLERIHKETEKRPGGWKLRAKALLVDFLIGMSRAFQKDELKSRERYDGSPAPAAAIMATLELPESNRGLTVEEMASASGYSTTYYSRLFKKLTGITPSAYLISIRMAAAAEMLKKPGATVAKTAELLGFDDVNYFSRLFKKETGVTPREFRNGDGEDS